MLIMKHLKQYKVQSHLGNGAVVKGNGHVMSDALNAADPGASDYEVAGRKGVAPREARGWQSGVP